MAINKLYNNIYSVYLIEMNLQKKLIQLSEYKCSFKYVDSYFLVSVTYPESWSIIPSEDNSIEVAEENGVTFYAAPIETDIEVAFTLIDDTIAYNLDVEKKMNLLKYNINKLQELFGEKDLEELETIEFVFKTPKDKTVQPKKTAKKPQRKPYTRRKKTENPITMEDTETNNIDTYDKGYDSCLDSDKADNEVETPMTTIENKYLEEVER